MKSNHSQNLSTEQILGEILCELTEQLNRGGPIDLATYEAQYPELASQIRELVPTIEVMNDLGWSDGSRTTDGQSTAPSGSEWLGTPLDEPRPLGDFRILRELGRGGMGVVYEAEQLSLGRRVALKVLPYASVVDRNAITRFKNESRAAAGLDHPHIVSVYAVGEDRGVHYYAMQLIRGQSLADLIAQLKQRRSKSEPTHDDSNDVDLSASTQRESGNQITADALSSSERPEFFRAVAQLGIQAADALQYAHNQGVLHRDIKPGNLLLDTEANLYVADFGLARLEADAGVTMTGDLVGTLRYMSPEQALAKHSIIDHRSDIYSLGATLYELLTLRPVFIGKDRQELLRQIAESEPVAPRLINPSIPRDLETIVLKSITKEPSERYQTAGEMADDLRRYSEDFPIRARRANLIARASKMLRRHRSLAMAIVGVTIMSLSGSTIAISIKQSETNEALAQASMEAKRAGIARAEAEQRALEAKQSNERARELLYVAEMKLASDAIEGADTPRAAELINGHTPNEGETDYRGIEWSFFKKQISPPQHRTLGQLGITHDLERSPQGQWLAAAGEDEFVHVWNASRFERQYSFQTAKQGVYGLAWSPDAKLLAAACHDGTVLLWDFPSGELIRSITAHEGRATDVTFTPDGKELYSCGFDSLIKRWEVASGKLMHTFQGHEREVEAICLQHDGKWLASASSDGSLAIWNTDSSQLRDRIRFDRGRLVCVTASPDGRYFATGDIDGHLYLIDVESGGVTALEKNVDGIESLAFFDGSEVLATADRGGSIQLHPLHDAATIHSHTQPIRWIAHTGRALSIATTANGKQLVSGGQDCVLRLWKPDLNAARWHLYRESFQEDFASGVNHQLFVAGGNVSVWDVQQRRLIDSFLPADSPWIRIACSADGGRMAAFRRGEVALADVTSRRMLRSWQLDVQLEPHRLAISPDGRLIAMAEYTDRSRVLLFDCDHPDPIREIPAQMCETLAFSPDGRWLAAGELNDLKLVDLQAADRSQLLHGHSSTLACAAFDPSSQFVATVGHDRLLKVWRVGSGKPEYSVAAHHDRARRVCYSHDGKTILTVGEDGVIKFWHAANGQPLGAWKTEKASIQKIAIDSDGLRLAVLGEPSGIMVYDASPAAQSDEWLVDPQDELDTSDTPHFRPLIGFTHRWDEEHAERLSSDGSYAVGTVLSKNISSAYLWSRNGGVRYLPFRFRYAAVRGVSDDGRVICGSEKVAQIWTDSGASRGIDPAFSGATDVSPDGKTVVGKSWDGEHWHAFRWDDGETTYLPGSPDHHHAEAAAISPTCDVILGRVYNTAPEIARTRTRSHSTSAEPVLWTRDGLQRLQGFDTSHKWWAYSMSDDGSRIVGVRMAGKDADNPESRRHAAFLWESGQVTLLGVMPGCEHSEATAISGDGRLIAGYSFHRGEQDSADIAFVWDRQHGMRSVAELLARESVIAAGWELHAVKDLSRDGMTLLGEGLSPEGVYRSWEARLPIRVFEPNHKPTLHDVSKQETHP